MCACVKNYNHHHHHHRQYRHHHRTATLVPSSVIFLPIYCWCCYFCSCCCFYHYWISFNSVIHTATEHSSTVSRPPDSLVPSWHAFVCYCHFHTTDGTLTIISYVWHHIALRLLKTCRTVPRLAGLDAGYCDRRINDDSTVWWYLSCGQHQAVVVKQTTTPMMIVQATAQSTLLPAVAGWHDPTRHGIFFMITFSLLSARQVVTFQRRTLLPSHRTVVAACKSTCCVSTSVRRWRCSCAVIILDRDADLECAPIIVRLTPSSGCEWSEFSHYGIVSVLLCLCLNESCHGTDDIYHGWQ